MFGSKPVAIWRSTWKCTRDWYSNVHIAGRISIKLGTYDCTKRDTPNRWNNFIVIFVQGEIATLYSPVIVLMLNITTSFRTFSQKCLLKYHMRIHNGERPFKCPSCDTAFADKSNLKKHSRIHSVSPLLRLTIRQVRHWIRNHRNQISGWKAISLWSVR